MAAPRGWAFIDLAELGVNTWRSYAASLLRIVLLPLAFLALAFALIALAARGGLLAGAGVMAAVTGVAFASVVVAGASLAWSVARSHRRPWMSLVSTDLRLDWRRLAIGAAVEGGLLALLLLLGHLPTVAAEHRTAAVPAMTLPAAVAAIVLVPLQAASEEVLFRGYLTQALGRLSRSRILIAAVVAVLFAVPHWTAYGPLTMPYMVTLSLIYSLVSLRDERLELTIGAHAATNWFGVGAGWALGVNPAAGHVSWPALALLFANGALFYGLTRLLVRLLCGRPSAA